MEFDLRRARVLMIAGQRDKAVKLFEKVATVLRQPVPPNLIGGGEVSRGFRLAGHVALGVAGGLAGLAAEHAALFAGDPGAERYSDGNETVFEILFGADADAAETAYRMLRSRQAPTPTPARR